MSNSVGPHRRQPTRLCRPWDSPGKNTGVGCHFLLQCMKVKSESEVAQSCLTLMTPWAAAYQAPPSMGFSRQDYWSEVPLPSPTSQLVTPFNEKSRFLTSFCNISSATKLTRATFRFENSFHHSFPSMNSNICFPEASWKRMIHDI